MLAYLSRYTHRVAVSNSRLIRLDDRGVTFCWKDYRARGNAPGKAWIKPMTLAADEFIRRFLLHVLQSGFHRIRHYGLFASSRRANSIDRLRELIAAADARQQSFCRSDPTDGDADADHADAPASSMMCPGCGGRMRVVEMFARGAQPRSFTAEPAGTNSS